MIDKSGENVDFHFLTILGSSIVIANIENPYFLKPLAKHFVMKLDVKIKGFWNPMRTQFKNPSGSSLAVVLGRAMCQSVAPGPSPSPA